MDCDAYRDLAFDTVDNIAGATSFAQISRRFAGNMAKLGFTSWGVNAMPSPKLRADPIVLAERAPAGFRDCYNHERIYPINHIAAYARSSIEPFRFSEAPYVPAQARDNERYMQLLRSFGLGEGLMVPLGRPIDLPIGVWLAGERPQLDDAAMRAVHLVTLFAVSKVHALARPRNESKPSLTARERDVLTWAARGKSAWQTGEILNIAKRTVDQHTQIAMRKLSAVNKTQAVAIALAKHIIEI